MTRGRISVRRALIQRFPIFDVEAAILQGQIVERQADETTRQWKYRIRGNAAFTGEIEIVVRVGSQGKPVYLL